MKKRDLVLIILTLLISVSVGPNFVWAQDYCTEAVYGNYTFDSDTRYNGAEIAISDQGNYEILVSYVEKSTWLEKVNLFKKYSIIDIDEIINDDIFLLKVPADQPVDLIIASLLQEPFIEHAQPNYIYGLLYF